MTVTGPVTSVPVTVGREAASILALAATMSSRNNPSPHSRR